MRIPTAEIIVNGRKKIVNADDPRVTAGNEPDPRAEIDGMKKADLVEMLEAHGADTSGKVADLRARLKNVMFVDM